MSAIQDGINRANVNAISNAARIQRWTILPVPISLITLNGQKSKKSRLFYFNPFLAN
jgi:hypothetical protein